MVEEDRTMVKVLIVFVIGLVIYIEITWNIAKKNTKRHIVKNKIDLINIGSTYAYYGLNYDDQKIRGVNLANVPQYLNYDYILLKKYIKYMKKDGKVLITLPVFVFASKNKVKNQVVYYEMLLPWEIYNYNFREHLFYIYKAACEPITHQNKKRKEKWLGYVASINEKEEHADRRINDWENVIGIPSVKNGEITEELKKNIACNIDYVLKIIELCRKENVEPVILLFPQSSIMRKKVSLECLETYLFNPTKKIIKMTGVRLIDCTKLDEFADMELYMNSDCFNEVGRKKFTNYVIKQLYEL